MSGFTYSLRFNAIQDAGVARTLAVLERIDSRIDTLNKDVNRFGDTLASAGRKGERAFNGTTNSLNGLISRAAIAATTINSIQTAAKAEGIQKAIEFSSGAAGNGARNIEFINKTVEDLGLSLTASQNGFKQLSGGMQGTRITGEQTRDLFLGMAEASTVMRMSSEQTEGAYLALSQMASKGKVQAEELRGQLGERLPGAFNLAARAMGVTTVKLNKMLDDGKVMSEDFLPKFARELHRTFGSGVADAQNSATANFNRMQNSLYRLRVTLGQELMPTALAFVNNYLMPAAKWLGENINMVIRLATVVGGVWVAYKWWTFWIAASRMASAAWLAVSGAYTAAIAAQAATTGAATFAQKAITVATWAFNVALRANPIGIVVTALGLLVGATIWAWKNFAGFRGFLTGVWAVLKETAKFLFRYLVTPFLAVAKTIIGALTFDKDMLLSGIRDSASLFEGAGSSMAAAYQRGYKSQMTGAQKPRFGNAAFDPMNPQAGSTGSVLPVGVGAVNRAFANTKGGGSSKEDKVSKGVESIVGGGKQTKYITINVGKLVEQLTVQAQKLDQGVTQVRDLVQRELLQVLNTANQVQ